MPARRLLMRKIREILRLKHERGLSHRAIAQACAIGVGHGFAVFAEDDPTRARLAAAGRAGRRGARSPLVPPCPRRCASGSGPTARTSTASSSATASRCSSSGRSTPRSIRTATATPSSARSTGSGRGGSGRRCDRCTGPARRRSSTSPGSGRPWSIPARARCGASSYSSPRSVRAASPTPRRPQRSSCPPGVECGRPSACPTAKPAAARPTAFSTVLRLARAAMTCRPRPWDGQRVAPVVPPAGAEVVPAGTVDRGDGAERRVGGHGPDCGGSP